ncbi:hypothetical protein LPJ61_000762 [Coemansia biformis]|uniref:RRM domain-containing protein n=1 Tax=Coemansia biformis TaxID=1286918 RepID=A0A9W7YB78_9FUNG|nr:hypothetical protein LPJ61_000762 [Coemansia biformis]
MEANLDRALDDIITDGRQRGDRQPRNGRGSGRNSPYSRDNNTSKGRSGGDGGPRGRWAHDKFGEARSINDRLGRRQSPSPSSGGRRRNQARQQHHDAGESARGITIARRTRDTAPYADMRVVWVTDLPHEYTSEKIENMFRDAGRIDSIRMAIDNQGRFVGKAEIFYRDADDARNAIQVFDGEMLYTTDSAGQVSMRVAYSSPSNSEYIDTLRHENSLPAPRAVPLESRLGGYNASAMAAYAMSSVVPMFVTVPVGQAKGGGGGGRRNRGGGDANREGSRRQGGGRGHRTGDDSGARPTAEDLDAEMDAYMHAAQAAKGAARAEQADAPGEMDTE